MVYVFQISSCCPDCTNINTSFQKYFNKPNRLFHSLNISKSNGTKNESYFVIERKSSEIVDDFGRELMLYHQCWVNAASMLLLNAGSNFLLTFSMIAPIVFSLGRRKQKMLIEKWENERSVLLIQHFVGNDIAFIE